MKAAEKAHIKLKGSESIKAVQHQPDIIYIKHNQRYEKLSTADILYVESMLNYVHIITANGKYTIYSSLKQIENSIPEDTFLRIHKSYLVNIRAITAIEKTNLFVGGYKLPVSRSNRNSVIKAALTLNLNV